MKILENGNYLLDDGTEISADEIGKQYKKSPRKVKQQDEADTLQEGECSGPIQLHD